MSKPFLRDLGPDSYFTAEELAETLGAPEGVVREAIRSGEIDGIYTEQVVLATETAAWAWATRNRYYGEPKWARTALLDLFAQTLRAVLRKGSSLNG